MAVSLPAAGTALLALVLLASAPGSLVHAKTKKVTTRSQLTTLALTTKVNGTADCYKLEASVLFGKLAANSAATVSVAITTRDCANTPAGDKTLGFAVSDASIAVAIGSDGKSATASGTMSATNVCVTTGAGPTCTETASATFSVDSTCLPGKFTYINSDTNYFYSFRSIASSTVCEAGSSDKATVTVKVGGQTYTLTGQPAFSVTAQSDTTITTVRAARRLLALGDDDDEAEAEADSSNAADADDDDDDDDDDDEEEEDEEEHGAEEADGPEEEEEVPHVDEEKERAAIATARRLVETQQVVSTIFTLNANATLVPDTNVPCTGKAEDSSVTILKLNSQLYTVSVVNLGCGTSKQPKPSGTFTFVLSSAKPIKGLTLNLPTKPKKAAKVKGSITGKFVCFGGQATDCRAKKVKLTLVSAKPKCLPKVQYVRTITAGKDSGEETRDVMNGCESGKPVTAKITVGGKTFKLKGFSSWINQVITTNAANQSR